MVKKSVLLLFFIYSQLIFGQDTYYLEGKLGKGTIYMKIEDFSSEDNTIDATYFYQNSLKDILLEGHRNKDKFTLAFKGINDNTLYEKFELTKSANTSFKGFWIGKSGKKNPLELKPVDFSKYKSHQPLDENHYDSKLDAVKLHFAVFLKDSTSVFNGKKIDWYSEKHCRVPFFRLSDDFSETVRQKINPKLNSLHLEEVLSQLNCSNRFEYSQGNNIEYTVKIGFTNKDLLGFEIFRSWDCGGAHPDFGGQGFLYDLNTGKNYEIDEIIAFDKSVTSDRDNNFDAYSDYRTKYFAPKLFDLINQTQHFKKPAEDDEEACDYTNLEFWNFVSWNFTKDGIEFTPYFYRYARSCEEPFLVPFDAIRKYKNPLFPYNF